MVFSARILKNEYRDSVFLMRINDQIERMPGVKRAAVMMGTDANKDLMREAGLYIDEVREAGPNDLVIVLEAENAGSADEALSRAQELAFNVEKETTRGEEEPYRSLRSAVAFEPDIDLVLISTPGEYAYKEAMRSILLGRHTMIFSSNVPIEKEIKLKELAERKNLLVMGPDAGTAIVGGVGLGFFNVISGGPVGIVGAAGTGIQEVSSVLGLSGIGISAAIGTGSNDISESIGGKTMIMGLKMLDAHAGTKAVTIISKPPSKTVAEKVVQSAHESGKPVIINFIGNEDYRQSGNVDFAFTLEEAAYKSYFKVTGKEMKLKDWVSPEKVKEASDSLGSDQRYVRGLFSGGTINYESQAIFRKSGRPVWSNSALDKSKKIGGFDSSREDTFVDMGAEEFVRGVPHPMIDFRFRKERILKEANDPSVGVILLDIILGYGSNMDPASEISEAVIKARSVNKRVVFVSSIVGTEGDPQNISKQVKTLMDSGVLVTPTSARAADMALKIVERRWKA